MKYKISFIIFLLIVLGIFLSDRANFTLDNTKNLTPGEKAQLHQKVGQLSMEVDFLEKKCKQLGIPVKDRNS